MRRLSMTAGLWLMGCGFEPEGAVAFEPPAEYRAWFAATEACSERAGSFEKLRWFTVPGRDFPCPTGQCVARWEPGGQIYLAEFWRGHEMVVRHEMLHAILDRSGHPDPPFGHGCPLTWESWAADRTSSPSSAPAFID